MDVIKLGLGFPKNDMPNCIYCGASDVTEEHPLPRALGKFKGYVPLSGRLCSRCNGICGQLDEQLCRCGQEAFFRKFLGISGRPGHDDVNSFYRGSSRLSSPHSQPFCRIGSQGWADICIEQRMPCYPSGSRLVDLSVRRRRNIRIRD